MTIDFITQAPEIFKPGDIIGFSGDAWLSGFINLVTYGVPWWGISHVGIIAEVTDKNRFRSFYDYWGPNPPELMLFESTMNCPMECEIAEKMVDGVQAHAVWDCIDAYSGKAWHYPLSRSLTDEESQSLTNSLFERLGTEYDAIGAVRAGGVGFSWIESMLRKEDLSSLFCSELCADEHRKLKLLRTKSVSKWSPNRFTRYERKHGIVQKPRRVK